MKKMLVLTFALALLVGTTAMADYYATKADYKAGKLTPAPPLPKDSGDNCSATLTDMVPPSPFTDSGDTTGGTDTVNTLPLTCNGNYTAAPGPDDVYMFTVGAGNMLTFEVTTTDDNYDPSIYALSTCGDGATCGAGWGSDSCWARNASGPCGFDSDESFIVSGLAAGTYYFYVDSFYMIGSGTGHEDGPYDVVVTGTWPVELIEFSVD